jgi:hypothetical protein
VHAPRRTRALLPACCRRAVPTHYPCSRALALPPARAPAPLRCGA